MKGWLAFDIDGTITNNKTFIPHEVCVYFKQLYKQGWKFVFLTGRSFAFSKSCLDCLDFDYYFSAQNGSLLLEMPSKQILLKNYLDKTALILIGHAFEGLSGDIVISRGVEFNDVCYFRPKKIPDNFISYVQELQIRDSEILVQVDDFEIDTSTVVKCLAPLKHLRHIEERLKKLNMFEISFLRSDPFYPTDPMLVVAKKGTSKGAALMHLVNQHERVPIIAAGNDRNDASLLDVSDVKIAMKDSPSILLERANYIAPSVEKLGIISALRDVLRRF